MAGLCHGHYARKRYGLTVESPLRQWADPRRTLMEAAFAFADAAESDEVAYHLAWKRLYGAAVRVRRNKVQQRAQSAAHVRKR